MPLVPALCTQCGSKLEIDSGNEAGICPHCHTAFVTEKAINNYNTTNVTNIGSLHADVVKINDSNSIDNQVKSGDTFIKLNDYESAKKVFDKLTKECPYDYRGWWGLIKVETKNFENSDISKAVLNYIDELYEKTAAVISEGDKASVEEVYIAYKSMVNSNLSSLEKNASFNAQRLSELLNEHKSSYEKRINELINTEKYVQASAKRKVLYFRIIAIITTLVISAILGVVAAGKT
ncbi:MAG: hypothetical protein IJQ28_06850, partial [Clostridia bacterium]|nr:hypothetical protein [Clostridia bacterium]